MNKLARRAALSCALLASTALAAPALAQQPSVYQHPDANGVDLTDGSFNFSLVEASIGSGPGAVSLVRYQGVGGESDSLSVRFHRNVWNSVATISLTFGNRREEFTGAPTATTFTSAQGNGATLTKINASQYRYTAADGTITLYGPPPGLTNALNNGYCSPGAETACGLIATSTQRPDGATTTYLWDVGENCTEGWDRYGEPTSTCAQFWRQRGLTNNSGYQIYFHFQQEANPTTGLPGAAWHRRTGANLQNGAVPGSPARNVSYATPSTGVTDITTDSGDTWRITRDTQGYVSGIRRPGSSANDVTVAYAGTTNGIVSSVTADGVTTSYSRSVSGTTGTMTVTNALNQQTVVVSDLTIGRPTSVTDPLSRTTSMQYDAQGRSKRTTAPEGNYTELTYDSRGNVVQTLYAPKPGSGDPTITTSASYPATCATVVTCNLPLSTTDARGNTTDYTYDQTHGGMLTETAPAVSVGGSSVRPQMRATYAAHNGIALPSQMSTCQTGASCAGTADEVVTEITYGTNHLPTSVTTRDGSAALSATRSMTYDSAGELLTLDGPLAGTADTVRYRYDAARRRVGTVSPDPDGAGALPHRATRTTFRPDGQVSRTEAGIVNSQSDSDWAAMVVLQQVDVGYDANHRPVVESHASGGAMHRVVQTGYDALGRAECVAERMNPSTWSALPGSACTLSAQGSFGPDRISRTVRNAAGEVGELRVAVGTALEAPSVSNTYTPNGRALTVTDGEGNRTSYAYDGHDRLRRTYFPVTTQGANASAAGDYAESVYDAAGNIVSRRSRAGEVAGYTFDALNRTVAKDLPGVEPDVTYSYDLLGRMLSAAQPGHNLSFTYDALGRQLSQTNPMGTIGSTWDVAGRRTRITHPGGYYVEQDYLVTGEISAIRENGATSGLGVIASFAYDTSGRRSSLTRGNGIVTTYAYDPASRLSTLAHDVAGSSHDLTLGFTYNPAGQILSNTRSNNAYSWTGAVPGTITSTANGLNQLAVHAGAAATYDARGNLAAEGGRTFSYSSENLLTGFTGHGRTIAWTHDPLMRVHHQTTSNANSRTYLFDGTNMLLQNMNGNFLIRYVYGPGDDELLYSLNTNGSRLWMQTDERGSIVGTSDTAGNSATPITYDEFGQPSSWTANHGYAGTLFLGLSRLNYNRARVYDSSLGRFLQPDPIGYGDGMNMYAYVGGDPVNSTDPTGLKGDDIFVNGKRFEGGGSGLGTFGGIGNGAAPSGNRGETTGDDIVVTGERVRPRPRPKSTPVVVPLRPAILVPLNQPLRPQLLSNNNDRNYCTGVPDVINGIDISGACQLHDLCYSSRSPVGREQCDRNLAADIRHTCREQGGSYVMCHFIAGIYYGGVKNFGRRFYEGRGGR